MKLTGHTTNPRTMPNIEHEISIACAAVSPVTVQEACQSLQHQCQCNHPGAGHLKLLWV